MCTAATRGWSDSKEPGSEPALSGAVQTAVATERHRKRRVCVIPVDWQGAERPRAIDAKVLAVATGKYDLKTLEASKPNWVVQDLTAVKAEDLCFDHRSAVSYWIA